MFYILIILLLVLVFGLSFFFGVINFVLNIFRSIFTLGRSQNKSRPKPPPPTQRKKEILFDKSEAEDADYEEVK